MPASGLRRNAEARFRAGAMMAWRAALFLLAMLFGALAWKVVLQPSWEAASLQQALGPGFEVLAMRVAEEALRASPAILIAIAAWDAAAILRRFAHGNGRLSAGAASIRHMGIALFLAGIMALVGAPSLLASLDEGQAVLRLAFAAEGLALTVLGVTAAMAGRALSEGG